MNPQLPAPQSVADPRQQVLEQVKASTNVLLTVSANPTVDQLSGLIGMSLLLNKLGKHATAVFSGQVPSTIEFLQPEKTLEKTTDSLRDFIIALDKSKADKLRYKIEDKYVKIFITPYHTSLSDKDLEFSEGDYNVDLILTLGVKKREELDQTIIAHGRILHDATVISINNVAGADLGSINWVQTDASSISEMMVGLSEDLKTGDQKLLDEQIATCFLTGIVAQTDRFSNSKTTPQTMSLAAKLMNAGANQQLIASKLQVPAALPKEADHDDKPPELPKPSAPDSPPKPETPLPLPKPPESKPPTAQPPAGPPKPPPPKPDQPKEKATQDGALLVPHEGIDGESVAYQNGPDEAISEIHIDDQGTLKRIAEAEAQKAEKKENDDSSPENRKIVDKPPSLGGDPSSSSIPVTPEPSAEPLNLPDVKGLTVDGDKSSTESTDNENKTTDTGQTLSDLEQSIHSPHVREVDSQPKSDVDALVNLIGADKGLPQEQTAGSPNPTPPPPVPPPLPMVPPPKFAPGNMTDPNAGVPL